jgi:hypothetical protein
VPGGRPPREARAAGRHPRRCGDARRADPGAGRALGAAGRPDAAGHRDGPDERGLKRGGHPAFGVHELAHVHALRTVIPQLGGTPVARPTIDLDGAWQAFASGAGLSRPFRPLESETDFVLASFYFEENDVASVRSVLALIQNGTVRDAGTGAFGAEGYHGGFVRLALHEIGLVARRVLQDAELIQGYRNQLIANPADAVPGLFDQSGNPSLAPVNALGQTPSQTAQEHLNVLYLNRNAAAGGFFPNGLNGAIR